MTKRSQFANTHCRDERGRVYWPDQSLALSLRGVIRSQAGPNPISAAFLLMGCRGELGRVSARLRRAGSGREVHGKREKFLFNWRRGKHSIVREQRREPRSGAAAVTFRLNGG
jgi:hypothetical protein